MSQAKVMKLPPCDQDTPATIGAILHIPSLGVHIVLVDDLALEIGDLPGAIGVVGADDPEVGEDAAIPGADKGDLLAIRRPARILQGVIPVALREEFDDITAVLEGVDAVVLAAVVDRLRLGEENAPVRLRGGTVPPRHDRGRLRR